MFISSSFYYPAMLSGVLAYTIPLFRNKNIFPVQSVCVRYDSHPIPGLYVVYHTELFIPSSPDYLTLCNCIAVVYVIQYVFFCSLFQYCSFFKSLFYTPGWAPRMGLSNPFAPFPFGHSASLLSFTYFVHIVFLSNKV